MATYQTSKIKIEPSGKEYDLKDAKARQDLEVLAEDINEFDQELVLIKKSVSDGKTVLADAITQKGVNTEANDTLENMASNILEIEGSVYTGHAGAYYSYFQSVQYSSSIELYNEGVIPIYNGYPYVYIKMPLGQGITNDNLPSVNNFGVVAEHEWLDNNNWNLVAQYHNTNTEDGVDWLNGSYLLGLYNWKTSKDICVSVGEVGETSDTFYVRCYELNAADNPKIFTINTDSTIFSQMRDIIFDLHYKYEPDDGVGHLTLSYADVSNGYDNLGWNILLSESIILDPDSFGKPVFLSGPAYRVQRSNPNRQLRIDECALVVDGFVSWGNSSVYPFIDDKRPQNLFGWKNISGKWRYYENNKRILKTGWQEIEGNQYYFDLQGEMLTATWIEVDSIKRYVDTDGIMVTGWNDIADYRYFFNIIGVMQKSRWIENTYWVGADGRMARDEWVDSGRYYVDADGKWVEGAVKALALKVESDLSVVEVGNKVTITVTATGGVGNYVYKYTFRNTNTGVGTTLTGFISSNTYTWTANASSLGENKFYVKVIDEAKKEVTASLIINVTAVKEE